MQMPARQRSQNRGERSTQPDSGLVPATRLQQTPQPETVDGLGKGTTPALPTSAAGRDSPDARSGAASTHASSMSR